MGHLLDGKWTHEDKLKEIREDGKYVKFDAIFRNWLSADGSTGFKAEAGRYHLYSSVSCPWAHRTELLRALKRLDGLIGLTTTRQTEGGEGWTFLEDHIVPGTDTSVKYLHEVYALAAPDYTGRVTVPTLWDIEKRTIVSNESSEIIKMFNEAFVGVAPDSPDFYPEALRADIDAVNEMVLDGINNGVNRCGRGVSQEAYDAAFDNLFAALDALEERLSGQRYLCGPEQTLADWRLYPNLIRFDSIYYLGYKCNLRRIEDYPNLSAYLRDLYQTPGIAAVSDIETMKAGIYSGAGPVPSNGIVPRGPDLGLERAHGRAGVGSARLQP
ncbi:MAG: glutathione S-transferase family protein [Rhodospirillaceae bacterium]|nr:glutathione S-transferase family protein [Rhodospirillaceae bacterium]MBT4673243.1 glutathione S-transferase family protein [Rhodospirillaceae bacterium]MBT7570948.1 glutathione S-transferase family protein [Rhodospirillaceae bacterium]